MAKFVVYEAAAEAIYNVLPTPKEKLSNGATTAVNLGSGLVAGTEWFCLDRSVFYLSCYSCTSYFGSISISLLPGSVSKPV